MTRLRLAVLCLSLLIFVGCVKPMPESQKFTSISAFTGRLLVMSQTHRFQLLVDWKSDGDKGQMRLTHGSSGRIINVEWDHRRMRWQDNSQSALWKDLPEQELLDMGVILPPWMLAKIFLGEMPSGMKTEDNRLWKGRWGARELTVSWASEQQKVSLIDMKHGRKAVVMFDE